MCACFVASVVLENKSLVNAGYVLGLLARRRRVFFIFYKGVDELP